MRMLARSGPAFFCASDYLQPYPNQNSPTDSGEEAHFYGVGPELLTQSVQVTAEFPHEAIVLFDGGADHLFVSMAGAEIDWPVEHGALVSTNGNRPANRNHIVSRLHFRDARIHFEFSLPPKPTGNSGIYIHGHYEEMQIINSLGKDKLTASDIGALYGFAPPLVDACLESGRWQTYDILFHAPVRDSQGTIVEAGSISATLNGQKVQDDVRFTQPRSPYHPFRYGTTPYLEKISQRQQKTKTGPLFLQDHGSPVRFRNIWVLPLDECAFLYDAEEAID